MDENVQALLNTYLYDKDYFEYAYEHSAAFKRYYDLLPESEQKRIKTIHRKEKTLDTIHGIRTAELALAGPVGWAFLAIRGIANKNKKSKGAMIIETVHSPEFEELFTGLYEEEIRHV